MSGKRRGGLWVVRERAADIVRGLLRVKSPRSPFRLRLATAVPDRPRIAIAFYVEAGKARGDSRDSFLATARPDARVMCFRCGPGSVVPDDTGADPVGFSDEPWQTLSSPAAGEDDGDAVAALLALAGSGGFDVVGVWRASLVFHPEWLRRTLEALRWAKATYRLRVVGGATCLRLASDEEPRGTEPIASPAGALRVRESRLCTERLFMAADVPKLLPAGPDAAYYGLTCRRYGVHEVALENSYADCRADHGVDVEAHAVRVPYSVHPAPGGWEQADRSLCVGYYRSRRHEASFGPDAASSLPLSVLIPIVPKDETTLPYAVEFVRRNLRHPLERVVAVGPDDPRLRDCCAAAGCEFVDEDDAAPLRKADIDYKVDGYDRSGWLYQQIIKLNGDALFGHSCFLALDADTLLAAPQAFERQGRLVLLVGDFHHGPYFTVLKALLGETPSPLTFVSHQMVFSPPRLAELRDYLASRHRESWVEAILHHCDRHDLSGFSEFETYGHWVAGRCPDTVELQYGFNMGLDRTRLADYVGGAIPVPDACRSVSFHNYAD